MAGNTDDEAGNNDSHEEDTIHTFIRNNIKPRRCIKYIPEGVKEKVCVCGRDLRWHEDNEVPPGQAGENWSIRDCTKEIPCTSYGEIDMVGFSKDRIIGKPKYIRVGGKDLNMNALRNLMINYWEMPEPELILSVIGGTKDTEKLAPRLTAAIRQGLIKVSSSLNTWIITDGVKFGVSPLIGQAAHELLLQPQTEERKLTVVGIYTWQTIYKHKALEVLENEQRTRTYANPRGDPLNGEVVLDPYHTHFILVDDGRVVNNDSADEVRFEFENFMAKEVAKKREKTKNDQRPIVQLLIDGGLRDLYMVEDALKIERPLVVIKGSKGCADLICRCVERIKTGNIENYGGIVYEELTPFKLKWQLIPKSLFTKISGKLLIISTEKVFTFDVNSADNKLDKVIYLATIEGTDNYVFLKSKLILFMSMNRGDLAKENIFCPSNKGEIPGLHLDERMMTALINNQTELVDLFLEEGVVIQHFLTAERMSELYNQTLYSKDKDSMKSSDAFLKRVLSSIKNPLRSMRCCGRFASSLEVMRQVSDLIDQLTDHLVSSFYVDIGESKMVKDNQSNVEDHRIFHEQDLFLWAILSNRMALAKLLWRIGKEHVSSALIASAIMSRLGHKAIAVGEISLAQEFEMNSKEFEALAVKILSIAYSYSKSRTRKLLCRSLAMWKSHTCMTLASEFSSKEFLHTTACQTLLTEIWKGAMPSLTPSQTHNDAENANESHPTEQSPMVRIVPPSPGNVNFKRILIEFFSAPRTKFVLNGLLYMAFLCVLTCFVLLDMRPALKMSFEIIVWIWCVDVIFQVPYQIVREEQHIWFDKLRNWFRNPWNYVDLGVILCFFVSIGVRVRSPKENYIVYAIMMTLFYIRFMQFSFAFRFIGPQVVMVYKMIGYAKSFIFIYVMFVLAFGTFAHALMYPNSEPDWNILRRIFYYSYSQSFGDLNVTGRHNCTADDKDCNHNSPIGNFGLTLIMMGSHYLLLNLLIATFGNTLASLQSPSEREWSYYRCSLIQEFVKRPPVPPPFSIFFIILYGIWSLISRVCSNNKGKKLDTPFKVHLEVEDDSNISQFEQQCREKYYSSLQNDDKVDYCRETAEKLESMKESIESLRETFMSSRLTFQEPSGISRQGYGLDDLDINCHNPLSPLEHQRSDPANRNYFGPSTFNASYGPSSSDTPAARDFMETVGEEIAGCGSSDESQC